MARRKKGRDISGWVIVDKPAGIGSTDVVGKVRWAFQAKKAGHAGTLDPDATGVLVIALGEATKIIPLVTDALKSYDFTLRFGAATDTDDATGTVIATAEGRPDDDAIAAALPAFRGRIDQVPPAYSAVKVDGERAYDLARDGTPPTLEARPLWVEALDLTARPDPDTARLRLTCGKGGYVRSIARDLGLALGTRAHVTALRRTWSGPFTLDHAVTLDRIEAEARTPEIDARLTPLETGLTDIPAADVTEAGAIRLRNGNPGDVTATTAGYGDTAWARRRGRALAIGTYRAGQIHPTRVLNL